MSTLNVLIFTLQVFFLTILDINSIDTNMAILRNRVFALRSQPSIALHMKPSTDLSGGSARP
jgi:hypothetical protein